MDQKQEGKYSQVSTLNIVKLCGSELAFEESHLKQHVVQGFNALSNNLLKVGLGGKVQMKGNADSVLTSCLKSSFKKSARAVLICCVSPLPEHFNHSLAALKFCSKIRDCL